METSKVIPCFGCVTSTILAGTALALCFGADFALLFLFGCSGARIGATALSTRLFQPHQVPRAALKNMRDRQTNIFTMQVRDHQIYSITMVDCVQ